MNTTKLYLFDIIDTAIEKCESGLPSPHGHVSIYHGILDPREYDGISENATFNTAYIKETLSVFSPIVDALHDAELIVEGIYYHSPREYNYHNDNVFIELSLASEWDYDALEAHLLDSLGADAILDLYSEWLEQLDVYEAWSN